LYSATQGGLCLTEILHSRQANSRITADRKVSADYYGSTALRTVERVNRMLIPLLTKLSAPYDWYKYLDVAQMYLNSTLHRSIGMIYNHMTFPNNTRRKSAYS